MALAVGFLLFDRMYQGDFTGPFDVLGRIPGAQCHLFGKSARPICDILGLVLSPTVTLADAPPLDVLVIPGGDGVNEAMEDAEILAFVAGRAQEVKIVLSVCTGALLCGAAGLLRGRRATTHWASHHLLAGFGATPVDERVVTDGSLVTAAGVTSGIDGALHVAAMLGGDDCACRIQLQLQYAPEPPFDSGNPTTAPASVVAAVRAAMEESLAAREIITRRAAARLGL